MKKNTLKFLEIMGLSVSVLAGAVAGCGSNKTEDVAGTEVIAVTETEEVTEITEETEVTEETETTETEIPEETEVPVFAVTELSATKYAMQTVNVRKGPGSDHEKLGSLTAGQKVTVTGQADTGWFRIDYNGTEGFVSDKYLSDQKVSTPAKGAGSNGSAVSGNNGGNAGNTGAAGNTGNVENVNNVGNTNSAGNSGNTGSTAAPDNGSTGNAGSNGGAGNVGGTGNTDNSGNTGNAGGTDQGGATVPDNSGSADAGNNGGTATPPEGSVIDPNTGMSVPEDFEDDFAGMDVGGADDGTDLGGTSEWH